MAAALQEDFHPYTTTLPLAKVTPTSVRWSLGVARQQQLPVNTSHIPSKDEVVEVEYYEPASNGFLLYSAVVIWVASCGVRGTKAEQRNGFAKKRTVPQTFSVQFECGYRAVLTCGKNGKHRWRLAAPVG
eukprot:COSAG01_NODE_3369_length_6183_cov_20.176857_5_plen_130_part_00